ncbi:MAG: four helix bundle protein [Nitrospira sp.]
MLNKAITRFDVLKFFVQLAWESKLFSTDKYSDFTSRLEEIGRQLGGWKKGLDEKLQTKTPQK